MTSTTFPPKRSHAIGRPGSTGFSSSLRKAEAVVFESFRGVVQSEGVSPSEYAVLDLVNVNEGLSQSRLGEALGIDRSSVVALVDRFEERKFLMRTPSPHDRRSHALYLTDNARDILQRLAPKITAHEEQIVAALTPQEREQLILLLEKVGRKA
jgi:DNA-binding MarR family transcriptional regulator